MAFLDSSIFDSGNAVLGEALTHIQNTYHPKIVVKVVKKAELSFAKCLISHYLLLIDSVCQMGCTQNVEKNCHYNSSF
jgi:hypothetical protein